MSYKNQRRKRDYKRWISAFTFHFKNSPSLIKWEKPQEDLKKQANNTHTERKNLEKHSDDLFILNFFGFGENIWKILSAQYVVGQLKRFGKMKLKQDTAWDVRKATIKQGVNQWVQKSIPHFLFKVKNLNS